LKEKGAFFQSPYPDYYAMNVLFLKCKRILINPQPLVTIGISPKSFGFFYFNNLENQGTAFLKNIPEESLAQSLKHIILPGSDIYTSWLLAMQTIKLNFSREYPLKIDYHRYRFLQIFLVYQKRFLFEKGAEEMFQRLWKSMYLWEKVVYGGFLWTLLNIKRCCPILGRKGVNFITTFIGTFPFFIPKTISGDFKNIIEVFEKVASENPS
jgi:hypothetical protein